LRVGWGALEGEVKQTTPEWASELNFKLRLSIKQSTNQICDNFDPKINFYINKQYIKLSFMTAPITNTTAYSLTGI
jgi:hypothetical protein